MVFCSLAVTVLPVCTCLAYALSALTRVLALDLIFPIAARDVYPMLDIGSNACMRKRSPADSFLIMYPALLPDLQTLVHVVHMRALRI